MKIIKLMIMSGLIIGTTGVFLSFDNPSVTLIWLGGGLFVAGCLFALMDLNEED